MEELADTIIQDINDTETKLKDIYDKAKQLQTNIKIKDAMNEEYKKNMNNAKENEIFLLNTIKEMKSEEGRKQVKIKELEDLVNKRKNKFEKLIKLKDDMKFQQDKDKLANQRLIDDLINTNGELTKERFDGEKKTKNLLNAVKILEEELEKNKDKCCSLSHAADKDKEKIKKFEFENIERELNKMDDNEKEMTETIKNMKIKNETIELEIQKITFDDNNKREKIVLLKNANEALKIFIDNLEKEKDEGIEKINKLERQIKEIKNELTKIKKDDTGKSEHANEAKNKEPFMQKTEEKRKHELTKIKKDATGKSEHANEAKSKVVMQKTVVRRKRGDTNEETMESRYIRLESNKLIRKKIKKESIYEHQISKDDIYCIDLE